MTSPAVPVTVMVVDDETMVGNMTGHCLRRAGFRPVVFNDPLDALEWFRDNADSVSLVITDQTMPGMVGTALAMELTKLRPQLPIVLCSGYISAIDESDEARHVIRAVLTKPVPTQKLIGTVQGLVSES